MGRHADSAAGRICDSLSIHMAVLGYGLRSTPTAIRTWKIFSLNGGVGGQSRRPCQMLAGSEAPIGSAREEPGSLRRPCSCVHCSHPEGLIQILSHIHIPRLWNCLKCCGRFAEHTRNCSGSSIHIPRRRVSACRDKELLAPTPELLSLVGSTPSCAGGTGHRATEVASLHQD